MVRFVVYLFETGVCLSLLYLAYWLFLRKETYFDFNRIFLVGSIVLALAVPVLHLNFIIPHGSTFWQPARSITNFHNSYEEMIRMIDADFGTEPGSKHSIAGNRINQLVGDEEGMIPTEGRHSSLISSGIPENYIEDQQRGSGFSPGSILLIIYIVGVIYFLTRFAYLVIRLYLLAKRNGVTRQEGFRMVEINEEISPFSFFRFLFINNGSFNESEIHQVLEHEKAHISQNHTVDHLFAHGLAVFQWFNPFAWQIRKALKTTHEYIADRQVVNQGIEPTDYQSLLLRQVIGYHSVELVNNFNLNPIKKRIAMMNKNKSGLPAKFKAMLVIPFALIIFFLFADFTLKGNEKNQLESTARLSGLWVKQSSDNFSNSIYIQDNKFSFTEGMEIREYTLNAKKGSLILSRARGTVSTELKYEIKEDNLTLWWNDSQKSQYQKSATENTLDHLLKVQELEIEPPSISQYRLLDEEKFFRISYGLNSSGGTNLTFNGKDFTLKDLEGLVEKEKGKLSKLDEGSLTAMFLIDKTIPMELVNQVREELRRIGALHIAEGGYPHGDVNLSPMLYHSVALPRLLPPRGAKMLDKKEVEKRGGSIFTIDLSARNTTPRDVDEGLRKFIENSRDGKYIISLEYDGEIPYGQYIESVDMIVNVVYDFRKELALQKYQAPYDKLGEDLQRSIRKAYPLALSETKL